MIEGGRNVTPTKEMIIKVMNKRIVKILRAGVKRNSVRRKSAGVIPNQRCCQISCIYRKPTSVETFEAFACFIVPSSRLGCRSRTLCRFAQNGGECGHAHAKRVSRIAIQQFDAYWKP